jgi:hypothetical protein
VTRPQPVKLGPFVGGMNTASDPASLSESELVDCVNFELELDGSLASRPPIVETVNNGAWTERIVMIGRAKLAGGSYVIGSNANGTYAFNGTTWTVIQAGLKSRIALQYFDFVYIVATPDSSSNGGYWNGTTFATDANMPRGDAAIFHKSRMWIVPGINAAAGAAAHNVRFTDLIVNPAAPNPFVWTVTNLIAVGPGDGEKLIDITIHNDNIMLFKQDSTYVFAYETNPTEGILRKVNGNLGTSTYRCMTSFENSTFIYHEGIVYEIQNYDFKSINDKVPFNTIDATPGLVEEVFTCVVGTRLIVRYYSFIWVYHLLTKTWSRWKSEDSILHNFGPWVEYPADPTEFMFPRFYAGSMKSASKNVLVFRDGYTSGVIEKTNTTTPIPIKCNITTKNYDFGDPMHFKKLKWWGMDALYVGNVIGIANPVVLNFKVTWDQLGAYTWDQMSTSTWDNPLPRNIGVVDNLTDISLLARKFAKFLKALRFRQINFQIEMSTEGSPDTGPCRLFSLTSIIGLKEAVVAKVS